MKELTGKERLLRLLRGEPIDRIPISTRIHVNLFQEYFNNPDMDRVEGAITLYRRYKMDIIDWNCSPEPQFSMAEFTLEGPQWKPVITTETHGDTTHEIQTVKTPGGELRRVISTTQITPSEKAVSLTEHPIKNARDYELMIDYLPPVPLLDTGHIKKANELIGDDGITSPAVHGPFNVLAYCWRKMDDLLLDPHLNAELFHRVMDFTTRRLTGYAQQFADAGGVLLEVGANMANSKVVSADYWLVNVLPYENQLAEYMANQRMPCLFHNCGHAAGHLPYYDRLKHKIWGYLTPPPHGDTIFAEAVRILPGELILWGGIDQIDFLRQATPAQVREKVCETIATVKPRGNYILGTSDFLETNTPPRNIEALVKAGREFGRYEDESVEYSSGCYHHPK